MPRPEMLLGVGDGGEEFLGTDKLNKLLEAELKFKVTLVRVVSYHELVQR
jgi:hypothetical protein